jgi:hypothetical protein
MPQTNETPADKAGASCESCGGQSHNAFNPPVIQVQFLIAGHAIRPEQAAMLAALIFGGAA